MIIERHVSDVIVQRSEAERWGAVLRGAGLHVTATVGGVTVYRIPSSWLRSTGTASTSLRETLAAKSVTVSAR